MPQMTLELEKHIKTDRFMYDYEKADEVSDEENDKIINALNELSEDDLEIVKREIIFF